MDTNSLKAEINAKAAFLSDDDWSSPQTLQANRCETQPVDLKFTPGVYKPARGYSAKVSTEGQEYRLPDWVRSSIDYDPIVTAKAPNGNFDGRHVIGGQSRVEGGVYLSNVEHEAIAVDESAGSLVPVYNEFIFKLACAGGGSDVPAEQMCRYVAEFVCEQVRYVGSRLKPVTIARELGLAKSVCLDASIQSRIGAARHQALLAAYLFEKLIARGILRGEFFLDNGSGEPESEKSFFYGTDGFRLVFDPLEASNRPVEFTRNPFLE